MKTTISPKRSSKCFRRKPSSSGRGQRAFGAPDEGAGFTLLEVVVSLTIMAALAVVAFGGLSVGIDSWRRGTRGIDKLDRRATVERLLRRQLAVAYPMVFQVQNQSPVLFAGSSNAIEFIADYSLMDGPSDFRKIDYVVDGGRFLYGEQRLFQYVPDPNDVPDVKPIADFSQMAFRFLGRAKSGELEWVEEWKLGSGLPIAVEVRAEQDRIVIPLVNSTR